MVNRIRTPEDHDRFRLALAPIDHAMWASEQRWGVGRLERLQKTEVLSSYRRGWDQYRAALEACDGEALEQVGPKMIQALAYMDSEATAAGHQPLDVSTWETPMGDGVTLCVVRTSAEASALLRAAAARDGASFETTLPPDLATTVRNQHEGRALVVVTLAEVARLMQMAEAKVLGTKWEGSEAHSGVQMPEMAAHDLVRSGFPLPEAIAADAPKQSAQLDF